MATFALNDAGVAALINQERYENALEDFGAPVEATKESAAENNLEWIRKLAISPSTGAPAKTIDNLIIILENDPMIKGKLAFDEFANRGLVLGSLPWDAREERRQWTDTDDAGLRHYVERLYGITGKEKIFDAVALCAH